MNMRLIAHLQHMADEDVLEMVNPDTLARLRADGAHPTLKVFGIAHEGEARGKVLGMGERFISYAKDVIHVLAARLREGTKVFLQHATTNAHEGREEVGEVVGKGLRQIGGKLHALAVVRIFPAYQAADLDVASIEAETLLQRLPGGGLAVDDVAEVSGIALGNHRMNTPGFPGATLLAAIQAFADDDKKGKAPSMPSRDEIKEMIREGSFKPSDLFGKDEILADKLVTTEMTRVQKDYEEEKAHAKRVETKLGEARDAQREAEKKAETESKTLAALRGEHAKLTRGSLFAEAAKTRNLDEKQKLFIEKNLERFLPTTDDPKKELDTWLEGQIGDYAKVAEIFGVKPAAPLGGGGAGAPPGDKLPTPANGQAAAVLDYSNPAHNELIPAPLQVAGAKGS